MKIIINFLFTFFVCKGLLFAGTANETQFTIGADTSTNCQIKCPQIKAGYFSRIAGFEYDTGVTSCYVYSNQDPTKQLATVVNENKYCSQELINTKPSAIKADSSSGTEMAHLERIRSQILSTYTDGGDSKFVNLSKYMVAGLMADDAIIDIPTSISSGKVTLNGGYTDAPSITYNNANSYLPAEILSRSKFALSNSVTFVINFIASSDKILMSFQVAMFLLVVALSLGLLLTQKATKKVSQIQDHDDMTEKVLFGVVSILIFFLPMNKIATPSGDISQTGYQQLIRPLLYLGVETADKLTETATNSLLKYKFGAVGVKAIDDVKKLEDLKFRYEAKRHLYNKIYENLCLAVYDTAQLQERVFSMANNLHFPNSEYITYDGGALGKEAPVSFYSKKFVKDEAFLIRNELPSVSFCFKAEKGKIDLENRIAELDAQINVFNAGVSPVIKKKVEVISELVYKNVSEFGFLSIGNLATSTMAFNNFSIFDKDKEQSRSNVLDTQTRKIREATGYEVSSVVEPDDGWYSISNNLNQILTEAPYFMLPMASSVRETVRGMFDPLVGSNKKDESGQGAIGWVIDKLKVNPVTDFLLKGAINLTVEYVTALITLGILMNIVAVAPLIAIIGASFLVVSFYFLSIEILYLVIPFASIFAFSTGNVDIIKNLVKHTFLLSIKPVLIVVSVLMAMFVYEMFQDLNDVLITSMFEPLFALSNNMTSDSAWYDVSAKAIGFGDSAIFLFMKSLMHIVSSIITVFVCFYLVFNGANIFLDLLGMKDGGFDVGAVIGDKIEGKSTVSKMNTTV